MKSIVYAAAVAIVLAVPVTSFAQQDNSQKSRAEVRAELVQSENAGQAADSGYGAGMKGSSQAGGATNVPPAPGKAQRNPLGVYFGN